MRFHCGISFSWKTIKKWLFPFLIGFLSYFFINGFDSIPLGFIQVKAYTNLDTTYNIDIPNYKEQLEQKTCGNTNLSETFEYLVNSIDWATSYYQMFVARPYYNGGSFPLRLYFKTTTSFENQNLWVRGRNNSNYFQISPYNWNYDGGYFDFSFSSCSSSLDVNNSQIIQQLINLIQNGTAMTITYDANIGNRSTGLVQSLSFDYSVNYQFNNNSSYTIPFWYFYNSFKWNYAVPSSTSTYYYKTLYFVNEDKTYTFNDSLDSYYDLHYNQTNTFISYKSSLGTIYTNFSPQNVSNFDLKLNFNTLGITALQYEQNLSYNWGCYARINHNDNYYTYEQFSYCDFEEVGNYVSDSTSLQLRFNNFKIYDSNDNVITNFSNYDKIFFYIDFNYKNMLLPQMLSSMTISFPYNYYYEDSFLGPIYDNFDLTNYFKMFVSTNRNTDSYFYSKYSGGELFDRYFLYYQPYFISNLNPIGEQPNILGNTFQRLMVSKINNKGIMIYHQISDINSGINIPKVDLVLYDDFVVSINDLTSGNYFYYVDSNGNITSSNIDINYDYIDSQDYDISYYFGVLNSYIYDLNVQCLDFANLVQSFYDSTPTFFQLSIYVSFILLCLYFLYLEIKR